MRILITDAAGFIGSNLVMTVFGQMPDAVALGIDNMNDYYDVRLKEERRAELEDYAGFEFVRGNIADKALIDRVFASFKPEIVVNLAAPAGGVGVAGADGDWMPGQAGHDGGRRGHSGDECGDGPVAQAGVSGERHRDRGVQGRDV